MHIQRAKPRVREKSLPDAATDTPRAMSVLASATPRFQMASCGMLRLASTLPSAPHFRATIRRSGPVAAFQKAQTFLLSASLGRQKALPLRILLHSLHVDKLQHICMPRQCLPVKKLYLEPLPIPLWIVTP